MKCGYITHLQLKSICNSTSHLPSKFKAMPSVRSWKLSCGAIKVRFLWIFLPIMTLQLLVVIVVGFRGNGKPGLLHQGVIILCDNARYHTANWTCDKLQCYSWESTDHFPYSPDPMPTNFHLVGPLNSMWLVCDLQQMPTRSSDLMAIATGTHISSLTGYKPWSHGGTNA